MSDEYQLLIQELWELLDSDQHEFRMTTSSAKYDQFRPMLRVAQKSLSDWIDEPDEQARTALALDNALAWQTLFEWLVTAMKSGDWNPEWLGWCCYGLLFGPSPLEHHNNMLEVILLWIEKHKQPETSDQQRAYSACFQKMEAIYCDSQGEPLILVPIRMIPLTGHVGYAELSSYSQEQLTELRDEIGSPGLQNMEAMRKLVTQARLLYQKIFQISQKKEHPLPINMVETELTSISNLMTAIIGDSGIELPESSEAEQQHTPDVVSQSLNELNETASSSETTSSLATAIPSIDNIQTMPQNRDQARAILKTLVQFFQATEPLSPVPYLLDKALRWTGYTLPQLLTYELKTDSETRSRLCQHLGLHELSGKHTNSV
ncbi:hypothetical protein M3P05_02585 [Sansalvadorimonas sp. 2012CJ34-2]|uniref:ImpA N-terminal domain-containing protein n=1 Tax=Parendozoicomonas callyspongiae TaxID=2942213 RepID=A0ABT0PDL1_9GAMM|nr:hypothetical protein [Sansalvadorimonas sp. 2012CJ34-2]MCL6268837.1 hypothetical protein [Sansalvadorimonas sp. 2012CJ34-2]